MTKDNPETMSLAEPTVWQETAMQGGSTPPRTVMIGRADLESAVHGGVLTTSQAKALWLRWTDPGLAASLSSGPGQRMTPLPEASGASSRTTLVLYGVIGVLALLVVLVWFFKGASGS